MKVFFSILLLSGTKVSLIHDIVLSDILLGNMELEEHAVALVNVGPADLLKPEKIVQVPEMP